MSVETSGEYANKAYVLEDDPVLRDQLNLSIHKMGWSAVPCSNGREFIEKLTVDPQTDVNLFLDLQLPGEDGAQVLARAAEMNRNMRVCIVTGAGANTVLSARMVTKYTEHELTTILMKPFRISGIARVLEKWSEARVT